MSLEGLTSKTNSHVHSLDGLRGVAALVVVAHHLLLTLPWFADRVGLGQIGTRGNLHFLGTTSLNIRRCIFFMVALKQW